MGQGSSSSAAISAKTNKLRSDLSTLKTTVSGLQTKVTNFNAKSIDYTELSGQIVNNENITKIIEGIIKSPDKLASALVPTMIKNTSFVESINQNFMSNGAFAESVAKVITSNPTYKSTLKGDKGEPGNLGNLTSIKSNLFGSTLSGGKYPATLWCADDELCQLPKGNKGIDWGYGASKIIDDGNLKIISDDNIGFQIGDYQNVNLYRDNLLIKESVAIQFGDGFEKEVNAGQISYGRHDGGASLNIVGAGKKGHGRKVRIWDELIVGGRDILGEIDSLIGHKNDILNALQNQVIRKDRTYGIRSSRGGFLSDQDGWKPAPKKASDWEAMTFHQI